MEKPTLPKFSFNFAKPTKPVVGKPTTGTPFSFAAKAPMEAVKPVDGQKAITAKDLRGVGLVKRDLERAEKANERAVIEAQKFALKLAAKPAEAGKLLVDAAEARMPAPSIDVPVLQVAQRADVPKIEYDESQQAAIEGIIRQKYACLIGSAGTGKTTVTKELIRRIVPMLPTMSAEDWAKFGVRPTDGLHPLIGGGAFTGRAVQQAKRALDPAYHPFWNTIHRTLGFEPVFDEVLDTKTGKLRKSMRFEPTFTRFRKLPFKVFFVDEAGMLGIELWNQLLDALPDDCRIILIGDINQLPPVMGRSVLGYAMTVWPTFELSKIHRQAEGNPIIENAHAILNGRFPRKVPGKFDIVPLPAGGQETFKRTMMQVQLLHKNGKFDPLTDALIVPKNVGNLGQVMFNEQLVHYFNPKRTIDGVVVNPRVAIQTGMAIKPFAAGDKVMILANNYDLGLTNGMIGVVKNIVPNPAYKGTVYSTAEDETDLTALELDDDFDFDFEKAEKAEEEDSKDDASQRQANHIMTVVFDRGTKEKPNPVEVEFKTAGDYRDVTHAYACTCHKTQGGEYPVVVICLHSKDSVMLYREWLYTAVTRAQERVVLMCNDRGLAMAVNNQKIKGRTVQEKAQSFLALSKQTDTQMPVLPQAQEI